MLEDGAKSLMDETLHGYRNQVVELQKALEQERQLRAITERMLNQQPPPNYDPQNQAGR